MSEDSDAEDIAEDDDDVFAVHDEPFVVQPCVAEEVPFFGRLDDFEHLSSSWEQAIAPAVPQNCNS